MTNINVSAVSFDLNPAANTYQVNGATSTLAATLARSSGSPARTTAGLTCATTYYHRFINDTLAAVVGSANGTLVIDWQLTSDVSFDLFDVGSAEGDRICIYRAQGDSTLNYYWGKNNYNTTGEGQVGSGFSLNTIYRTAYSMRSGSMRFCHNGGSVITDGNAPPTKTGASIFGNMFYPGWNGAGRIRRVFFIPDDLNDADLQTIATQGNDYTIAAAPPDEATLVLPAGAKVFYSAKRANGYHGAFARVWRVSDNAEMDVAWNGDVPDYASVVTWAAGSTVRFRRVYNQVAGGAAAQQTTNALCPVFSAAQLKNGMVPICLDGDLVSSSHYLTYTLSANRDDLTVFEVITPLVSLAPTTYWEFDNGTDIYLNLFQDPAIGSGMCMFDGSGVQPSAAKPRAQLSTIGYTNNGTAAKLWNREGTVALVSHGAQAMTAGTIGRSLAGDYACGRANLFCHYVGTALNDTAAAAFRDLLNVEFSVPTTFTKRLLIGSDSLMEGYDCTQNRNVVFNLALDPDVEVFNLGIYGQQLSQEAANPANFLDLYDASKVCIALIDGGSNDFVGAGATAAAVRTTAVNWISTLKGAGFKTALMTILARADLSESTRTSYNASIRVDKAGADYLMDAGADTYLGDIAQTALTIWFSDGAHLTDAGYARLAVNFFQLAIDSLFAAQGILIEVALSEVASASGDQATLVVTLAARPEAASASDARSSAVTARPTQSEAGNAQSQTLSSSSMASARSEALAASGIAAGVQAMAGARSESLTTGDGSLSNHAAVDGQSEALSASDESGASNSTLTSGSEVLKAMELATQTDASHATLTEVLAADAESAAANALSLIAAELTNAGETSDAIGAILASISEAGSVSDAGQALISAFASLSESLDALTLSDASILANLISAAASETGSADGISDATGQSVASQADVLDAQIESVSSLSALVLTAVRNEIASAGDNSVSRNDALADQDDQGSADDSSVTRLDGLAIQMDVANAGDNGHAVNAFSTIAAEAASLQETSYSSLSAVLIAAQQVEAASAGETTSTLLTAVAQGLDLAHAADAQDARAAYLAVRSEPALALATALGNIAALQVTADMAEFATADETSQSGSLTTAAVNEVMDGSSIASTRAGVIASALEVISATSDQQTAQILGALVAEAVSASQSVSVVSVLGVGQTDAGIAVEVAIGGLAALAGQSETGAATDGLVSGNAYSSDQVDTAAASEASVYDILVGAGIIESGSSVEVSSTTFAATASRTEALHAETQIAVTLVKFTIPVNTQPIRLPGRAKAPPLIGAPASTQLTGRARRPKIGQLA